MEDKDSPSNTVDVYYYKGRTGMSSIPAIMQMSNNSLVIKTVDKNENEIEKVLDIPIGKISKISQFRFFYYIKDNSGKTVRVSGRKISGKALDGFLNNMPIAGEKFKKSTAHLNGLLFVIIIVIFAIIIGALVATHNL